MLNAVYVLQTLIIFFFLNSNEGIKNGAKLVSIYFFNLHLLLLLLKL